jgi:hypothetical protein
MDKTKRGIALFITLLVIASILSIVAISFTYLEKVQKDATKMSAIIQGNILYKNTTEILKRFFPKGKVDSKKLDMIYSIPLILSEPKSDFSINLQCKPLMVAIPIKWLDELFTEKTPTRLDLARDVLSKIMEKYDIKEPNRLEEYILAEITGKAQEYQEYEERIREKKGIISKKQFDRIILDYRLRYDDEQVFKIPWDKYFIFLDVTKKAIIDSTYVTDELVSMTFDIAIESIKDTRILENDTGTGIVKKLTLKALLTESGINETIDKKIFSDKALNSMHCEERYSYRDRFYSFSFDYSDERIANFEFNGEL